MRTLLHCRDARAGLVATVLGLVYLASAFAIEPDPTTTSVIGPRVAPVVIGVATVVCALALVTQALRHRDDDEDERTRASSDDGPGDDVASSPALTGIGRRQVLVSFAIFAAYVVAFIPLGYLLSTFLFLVAMTTYADRKKLMRNCIFAAVFSPAVYVLFNYGLQVQLPSPGLLG